MRWATMSIVQAHPQSRPTRLRGRGGEVRAIYVPLLVGRRVSCVRARSRRVVSDTIRLL